MITAFALLVLTCVVCVAHLITVLRRDRPVRLKRSTWAPQRGTPTEIAEAE